MPYNFKVHFHKGLVAVSTNSRQVLQVLKSRFRHFRGNVSYSTEAVSSVHVIREGDVYHVPSTDDISVCNGSLEDAVRCVEYHVVRHFVQMNPQFVWLHAGAVARGRSTVLLSGPSGSGKSTLVTALCTQGWQYLSDELVPLESDTLCAIPFPVTPALRIGPPVLVPSDTTAILPKLSKELTHFSVCDEPMHITSIVLPTFNPNTECVLRVCEPGSVALELIRGCPSLLTDPHRTLTDVSRLVERVPGFRLPYLYGSEAARVVDAEFSSSGEESQISGVPNTTLA